MKKILVALTGGTIGSRIADGVIDVEGSSVYYLLSLYEEKYGKEQFEVINPLNILSENMTPDKLYELLYAIQELPLSDYAGVIIAHGSDTLSFTSACIGLLMKNAPVPVVLTASNYPLSEEKSNGLFNFAACVDFIRKSGEKGAFTIYSDKDQVARVYLADQIVEADPLLDQFHDFSGTAYGKMVQGVFEREGRAVITDEEEDAADNQRVSLREGLPERILMIRPYPGLDYSLFQFSEEKKPAAVLHCLYHSATACTQGEDTSLIRFMEYCRKWNVPVYGASYKYLEGNKYASGDELSQNGLQPLLNMSPERAYAYLLLKYNRKM